MDLVYDKQKDLVKKLQEVAEQDSPSREEVLDLKQEINRGYHILNHFIRSQLNLAGRYSSACVGAGLGLMVYLYRDYKLPLQRRIPIAGCYMVTFFYGGYLFGRWRFSAPKDAAKNMSQLASFRSEHDPKIDQYLQRIEEKLKNHKLLDNSSI